MNRGKHKNSRRRNAIKGFDPHRMRGPFRVSGAGGIVGALRGRGYSADPEAPHFRSAAGTPALPGKHLRAVVAPPKADHCTD
ncbi:MAG: hypothetical protein LBT97_05460 [Planctomycetota bacterium]|jgi:hypothetical protein|nr:hypothetical protein [Planctomycetota bacterium]